MLKLNVKFAITIQDKKSLGGLKPLLGFFMSKWENEDNKTSLTIKII